CGGTGATIPSLKRRAMRNVLYVFSSEDCINNASHIVKARPLGIVADSVLRHDGLCEVAMVVPAQGLLSFLRFGQLVATMFDVTAKLQFRLLVSAVNRA